MRIIFSALLVGAFALQMPSAAVAQTGFFGPCTTGPFSGPYVGAQTGYVNGKSKTVARPNFSNAALDEIRDFFGGNIPPDIQAALNSRDRYSTDDDGWSGGLHAGYSWQCGVWVFGGESDFSWTDLEPTVRLPAGQSFKTTYDNFGTVRGNLGLAFGNFMVYGTGGFAYSRIKREFNAGQFGQFSERNWETGWTAGGGIKWAFANRWVLKAEALYIDLDDQNTGYRFNTGAGAIGVANCAKECGTKVSWDDELVVGRVGLSIPLYSPPAPIVPLK